MITVPEIVNDPDMGAQNFTVLRFLNGAFTTDGFTETPTTIAMFGTIQPAAPENLRQVPEADRVEGMEAVWCTEQLYRTNQSGTSDVIIWNSTQYRIISVDPWKDGGYWLAIAARLGGQN